MSVELKELLELFEVASNELLLNACSPYLVINLVLNVT